MTPTDKYDTSGLPEDQFEPGSDGKVLKNFLGITTREEMEIAETEKLWSAQESLLAEIEPDQVFTAQDVCTMHKLWLSEIYPWAGTYRRVNVSKGKTLCGVGPS
ncbi:MAG: hypothetical protein AB7D06_16460 [Pedobacter sp.]